MNDKLLKLISIIRDPEQVKEVWGMVKAAYPVFPKNACGATLSLFLARAGFDQSFQTWAENVATEALAEGWVKNPIWNPAQPGDIFVTIDANGNAATDHVGIVYAASTGFFLAIDNRTEFCKGGLPYIRNIGPGTYTQVEFFLRYAGA